MLEDAYKSNEGLVQLIALIIAYLSIVQPIIQYLSAQRNIDRDNRFKAFHDMIEYLAAGKDGTPMLARQISIVYELRRFPEYYPVTKRILLAWDRKDNIIFSPFYKEIDLTLKFIDDGPIKRGFFSLMLLLGLLSDRYA